MSRRTAGRRGWWSSLAVVTLLLVPFASPAGAEVGSGWRMIDLGVGNQSIANAVNTRGVVVGQDSASAAFLWRRGEVTDLGIGGVSAALDINNRDEVVGYRLVGENARAFLWRRGTVVDIGTLPGGGVSYAQAINDRGEVVGWSEAADGRLHAFHWRDGVLTDLGGEGQPSLAYDIDDAGRVVGVIFDEEAMRSAAVRWWRGTVTTLHDDAQVAVATSGTGAITGSGDGVGGLSAGFVWRPGDYVVIPQPPGELGMTFLDPTGINSRLQVVGNSSAGAFVWERGRTTFLPARSRAATATDINDRGVIVGANPAQPDGTELRAVLWTL